MIIPSTFELFGRTVAVVVHSAHGEPTKYGHWDSEAHEIHLYARGLPAETVEQTFCHELAHVLMQASAQPDLNKDEDYVDLLGSLLHQILNTFDGDAREETETFGD